MRSRSIIRSIQVSLLRLYHELIRRIWFATGVVAFGLAILVITPVYVANVLHARQSASGDVAIVLGGVQSNGTPSPTLRGNLLTAAELYKSGRAKAVLLSGVNDGKDYNEPAVMKEYVVEQGVPADAVVLDYSGYGMYDVCYRAAKLLAIRKMAMTTNGPYTAQALVTCRTLGADSIGVDTSRQYKNYPAMRLNQAAISIDQSAIQRF